MSYARSFEVERGSVDQEAGTFRAIVFSDGEASDGHRLRMDGAEVPSEIPLFVNHEADPRSQLGTLHMERITPHKVIMRGQIFTGGEGAEAEIRRDLLAKMSAGHVRQMSGRWDATDGDVKPRRDLTPDDPFYVDDDMAKKDVRKRYGLSFERWRALEGSIVGIGADPSAAIRFAEDPDASDAVRQFWRGVADEEIREAREEEPVVDDLNEEVEELSDDDILNLFRESVGQMLDRGFAFSDLEDALESHRPSKEETELESIKNEISELRKMLENGGRRVEDSSSGTPADPIDAATVMRHIRDERLVHGRKLEEALQHYRSENGKSRHDLEDILQSYRQARQENAEYLEQVVKDYRHLAYGGEIDDPDRRAAALAFKQRVEE